MKEPFIDTSGSAFWEDAVSFYNRPGAKEALLDLQDRLGGDVMASLWALSAAKGGRALSSEDVTEFFELTKKARMEASRLRRLRQEVKSSSNESYERLKKEELAAEQAVASLAPPIEKVGIAEGFNEGLCVRNLMVTFEQFAPDAKLAEALNLTKTILG